MVWICFLRIRIVASMLPARCVNRIGMPRSPEMKDGSHVFLDARAMSRESLYRAVALASGRLAPPEIPGGAPGSTAAPEPHLHPIAVLVAEDNEMNREVLARQLRYLGYAPDFAYNGAQALNLWRGGCYAVLITDLRMPVMDGYSLATAIRAEESAGQRLPIIALTANALPRKQNTAGRPEWMIPDKAAAARWAAARPCEMGAGPPPSPETGIRRSRCVAIPGRKRSCEHYRPAENFPDRCAATEGGAGTCGLGAGRTVCSFRGTPAEIQCIRYRGHAVGRPVRPDRVRRRTFHRREPRGTRAGGRGRGRNGRVLPALTGCAHRDIATMTTPAPVSILVVDDDALMRGILESMLLELGYRNTLAVDSGRAALAHLLAHPHCIDVIVLDLNMPEMDGVEFIRKLATASFPAQHRARQRRGRPGARRGHPADRRRAPALLGRLRKPVRPEQLRAMLGKIVPPAKSATAHAQYRIRGPDDLSLAVSGKQLLLQYQPLVALSTGEVLGVEGLIRWMHPVHGHSTGPVIPIAKKRGSCVRSPVRAHRRHASVAGVGRRSCPLTVALMSRSVTLLYWISGSRLLDRHPFRVDPASSLWRSASTRSYSSWVTRSTCSAD